LEGVGIKTCLAIASAVVANNLGFLDVFHAALPTGAFSKSAERAALRTAGICQPLANWNMQDTLLARDNDVVNIIANVFNPTKARYQSIIAEWQSLRTTLPDGMTLDELLAFTSSDNEVEQLRILQDAQSRLGLPPTAGASVSHRVRVLTMHGAKGLEGKVVFIPGFEVGIIPSYRALSAAGLMQESRRLLYVSITRARVCCVLSYVDSRTAQQAMTLSNQWQFVPTPSPFLLEIGVTPQHVSASMTQAVAAAIAADCANL
jgi:superfamily I DNA/RNA helicase